MTRSRAPNASSPMYLSRTHLRKFKSYRTKDLEFFHTGGEAAGVSKGGAICS